MTVDGVGCECNECGEVLKATNGEGLVQAKKEHRRECHPGFESLGKMQVPDPRVVFGG